MNPLGKSDSAVRSLPGMNERGHPQTLQAAQPGNANRLTHGAYAAPDRELDPAAEAVADWLMSARHTTRWTGWPPPRSGRSLCSSTA